MTKPKKPTYAQLERQNKELLASLVPNGKLAIQAIRKMDKGRMLGSGVLLEFSFVGGRAAEPVMIRDGLSPDTIDALERDILRSIQLTASGV